MFESSTPDGLAPIGIVALIVFISTIGGLSMLWGLANLFVLLKIMPEPEGSEKMERIFQINRKILRGAIDIFKYNSIVAFIATILFFMIILGAVEHFDSCYYSIAYFVGAFNSVLIAFVSIIASCLVKPKIINFARFGGFDSYDAAKKAANFQTYFFIGEILLIVGLFMVSYEKNNQQQLKNPQQILKLAKTMVSFSFGSATVAIASRIINSIYAKGAQLAVQTLEVYQDKLKRDYKHPALLARALGQIINKQLCSILDSVTYLAAGISVAVYTAGYNIVGTDQQGQITFNFAISNCYLPVLSLLFSLFYNFFFNAIFGIVIRPSSGDGVRTFLGLHRYITTILLSGFLALAAYLCLPAEFYMDQIGSQNIKHPYHAYLCLLFGLLVSAILSLFAQLFTTHPFFLNSVATSCKTGSATCIIYGISFGYLFNVIPVIFVAGTLFLADYWLGAYGIGLAVIGYLSLLPHYLNGSLVYSSLENSSFMTYITQLDQTIIQNLVEISKTRKDYEPHISTFYTGLVSYFGFQMIQAFVSSAEYTGSTSLKSPTIFFGLLVGAMLPYLFSSNLLRSIQKSAPAIPFDIRMQIQQIPGMATGNMDPDFVRNSSLFSFQCMVSLKRFVPILIGPMILIGIAGGPALMTGFICGSVLSGVQIGWSSGISGCAWTAVKKQIGLGNIRDQQGNSIKSGSDWQRAANVGNSIGQPLKDCISSSMPLVLVYWGLQSFMFAPMYSSIHS